MPPPPQCSCNFSNAAYEALGALTSATLGNGQSLEQVWSADGRLTARRLRQGALGAGTLLHGLAYAHDNDDNPLSITDEVDASRTVAFTYDAAERLARVDLASGSTRREDYIHDANGNRIRVERRALPGDVTAATTDTYTRTSGTNRIANIATAAGTRTLSHDARGNLSVEISGLAAGTAALALLHHEKGHGRLDTMLGIPREGFGFSRDPAIRMSPPR